MNALRVGIVGDYVEGHGNHLATDAAIEHSGAALTRAVDATWLPTAEVEQSGDALLGEFDALWMTTNFYDRPQGTLDAITYARTHDVPLIATCGGFQHVVIEYARNVVGVEGAASAQYHPDTREPVISELACSLRGQVMDVRIVPGSRAHRAYGALEATERYYCQFGVNPDYRAALLAAGLVASGTDSDDELRIIELPDHRFFVGTLFVPQASSTADAPHPLIDGFLAAASDRVEAAR